MISLSWVRFPDLLAFASFAGFELLTFFRKLSDDFISSKFFMIAIIYSFIIALIIHGHQTEATYRLDFLWKLQATGQSQGFVL